MATDLVVHKDALAEYNSIHFPCINSRDRLVGLAKRILALDIEERHDVHAQKMIECAAAEYSRAFYEVAIRMYVLLDAGYTLVAAVRALAHAIPGIGDFDYEILWGCPESYSFTYETLIEEALQLQKTEFEGPDRSLISRIIDRKASKDERKVFALRIADCWRRIPENDDYVASFFDDHIRCKKELEILRKNMHRVVMRDSKYVIPLPILPHWTDLDLWETLVDRGYGKPFAPCIDLPPLVAIIERGKARCTPLQQKSVTPFVTSPSVMSPSINSGSVLVPNTIFGTPLALVTASTNNDQEYVEVEEEEVVVHDNNILEEECEDELDDLALALLKRREQDVPSIEANGRSNQDTNLPYDKAFPALNPSTQPVQKQAPQPKNAWTERDNKKKSFMNAGIGGKLQHKAPSSPEFHIDMSQALSIQDVWGYALLGQYVGRHPGHFLINAMMKAWGVKSKYRIEEGWMIFYFDTEADQEKVLLGGPYLIQGRPLILKHIPDKFAFNRRDVAIVPLWVRIHGLASRFWTPDILGGIASYIGTPLYMDPVTDARKRHSYARVLVEINLAAQVTRKVPLKFSDGVAFDCTFLVENEPKYCHGCCSFGHEVSTCEFMRKKDHAGVKNNKTVSKPTAPNVKAAGAVLHGEGSGTNTKEKEEAAAAQDSQPLQIQKDAPSSEDASNSMEAQATFVAAHLLANTHQDGTISVQPHAHNHSGTQQHQARPPKKNKEQSNATQGSEAIVTTNRFEALSTPLPPPQSTHAPGKSTLAPSSSIPSSPVDHSRSTRAKKNGGNGS